MTSEKRNKVRRRDKGEGRPDGFERGIGNLVTPYPHMTGNPEKLDGKTEITKTKKKIDSTRRI